MAYIEIDPDDFIKGLRLLHSRTPESSDELKRLLDSYYVRQDSKKAKDFSNVFSALQSLSQDVNKNENDKRTRTSEDDSEATDIEDNENTDASEFASDLGLACVVCKQIEITTNNQLFECQDCSSLYHQECHKPPITKKDISDPRLVWYCSKCTKNVKKAGKPISTNKIATINKQSGSTGNLVNSINSISTTASFTSISYQSAPSKDASMLKSHPTFLKTNEAATSVKRGLSKFSSFNSYSNNSKPTTISSLNRATTSTTISSNKTKTISSSSSSSFPSLPNLDKRFPNLKKTKMNKY
ncbi:Integrator complex subunit 12 [Blomia tropicalis]|nr:Integrator complex subunit 12 [Blomia tropicalis]